MRSVNVGLVAAAMLLGTTALTTPAFAGNNNDCHNNCNSTPPSGGDIDIDNHNTAVGVGIGIGKGGEGGKGGKGGEGGDGGNAVNFNANVAKGGDAKAYGGDAEVKNSGNSFNANLNKNDIDIDNKDFNANVNLNKNVNKNEIDNKNFNANLNVSKNDNYNRNSNHQDQDQDQKQGQLQGQAQKVENVGNVHIENERPPVNTAYSAALATSEDTCMGSSSIGGQAVSFGLTIGTTWTDDNCQRLKNSRQLVALGYHRAATSLMCFNEDVATAMERAGTPCPSGPAIYVAPPPPEREYVPMAPIDDRPVKRKRRKPLPPK